MYEIQLHNADVGPLIRSLETKEPWILALAGIDCPLLDPGDLVRLWYPGDAPHENPAYPAADWIVRVRMVRVLERATDMTEAELTAILGFPEGNPTYMSQVWRGAANGRHIRSLNLISFDFD